jgi:type IV pilus assembly protein PilO
MKGKPSRGAIIALIVVGVLAYAAAGYLLVVSPQRSKSADLQEQIEDTEAQIAQYRQQARQAANTPPIRVADLFRLEKAMPNDVDMAGIVLELSRIARETGITFESITPQGATASTGFQVLPVTLAFDGNYFELSDFLYRLRSLVRVSGGRLDSRGRLFVVDSISFSESEQSFPRIQASLVVHAYVYGDAATPGAPAAAGTPPPPGQTGTTTTGTETTQTTTQPDPNTPPEPAPGGGTAASGGGS